MDRIEPELEKPRLLGRGSPILAVNELCLGLLGLAGLLLAWLLGLAGLLLARLLGLAGLLLLARLLGLAGLLLAWLLGLGWFAHRSLSSGIITHKFRLGTTPY